MELSTANLVAGMTSLRDPQGLISVAVMKKALNAESAQMATLLQGFNETANAIAKAPFPPHLGGQFDARA